MPFESDFLRHSSGSTILLLHRGGQVPLSLAESLSVCASGFLPPTPPGIRPSDEGWLDLDSAATVEVTSEAKEYPVESALVSGEMRGWRAADSGTQTIRLIFGEPQKLTRISLVFGETATARTQEFVLRWSADGGHSFREIVRQQFEEIQKHRKDAAVNMRGRQHGQER
jgi:hypothetical protein